MSNESKNQMKLLHNLHKYCNLSQELQQEFEYVQDSRLEILFQASYFQRMLDIYTGYSINAYFTARGGNLRA